MKKIKIMKNLLVYSHDKSTSCTSIEIQLWSCTLQNSHKISTKRTRVVITRPTLLFITMLKAWWTCIQIKPIPSTCKKQIHQTSREKKKDPLTSLAKK
jgi:hypothetical protein